jgi:hypothetical protein
MKIVKHSLQFITELDETNSTAQQLLALPETMQIVMLESMLKDLLAPAIQPAIDELNAGNSFATLKVVL